MKKYNIYFTFLSILAALYFVGCTAVTTPDSLKDEPKTAEQKNGNVTVSMFIPDYKAISESRTIAPQTKYARLKISSYSNQDILEIKEEDLTDVENAAEVGLPGKIWKAKFSAPIGEYPAKSLTVELLDSEKKVITSGSNSTEVTITEDQSDSCSFFTVPQSADNNEGSLALNEMKFFMMPNFKITNSVIGKKIRAVKADINDAVIIRFNSDGTFGELISDFTEGTELEITNETVGSYYGIWAKDNAVDSYSVKLFLASNIVTPDSPIIEEFDEDLDLDSWYVYGHKAGETVPSESAKTTNSSIYEHENATSIKFGSLSKSVYVTEPSAVTFSFYPDTGSELSHFQKVSFYINGETKDEWSGKGLRQTYTFLLTEAGEYELGWGSSNSSNKGTSYLDRVSIVADVAKSVEITPKGMQTVVAGEEYAFTVNALREDGSVIKSVTKTKTFTEAGKQTFSMGIDGMSTEATVNVIADTTSPVEYMGKTYIGINESTVSGSVANVGYGDKKLAVTYPTGNIFDADGFFPLKLNVNNPDMHQFVAICISGGTHSEEEDYVYRGNPTTGELETRIWLRWGKGTYTIKVYDAESVTWPYSSVDNTTSDDGTVTYYGDNVANITRYTNSPSVTFTVNNTRDEDGTYLYPSSVVQSDDITVMNKAADLTAGLTDTNAKIKAIHNWIVTSKYYDYASLNGKRKRQDAVAVMEYGMCVCEGYANLTAALLRSCGIQVKYISSSEMNHGWNNVNVGTEDRPDWRLLDSCWDDPTIGSNDGGPYYVNYDNYLLKNLEGGSKPHDKSDKVDNIGRAVQSSIGHSGGIESTAY